MSLTSWCKLISSISVISSVLVLIVPEGKLKKAYKSFLAVVILYIVLVPLLGGELDVLTVYNGIDLNNYQSESEAYEEYQYYPLLIAAEKDAEEKIENKLSDISESSDVSVECEYTSDESIFYRIIITGEFSEKDKEQIKSEIIKNVAENIDIKFVGENDYE